MVSHQDILRFEIPVVDSNRVAIHNSIENLEESLLGEEIITNKVASFSDAGKQIAFRTEFNDHEGTVNRIHYANQRHDIGMTACQMVKSDLSLLEFALTGVES